MEIKSEATHYQVRRSAHLNDPARLTPAKNKAEHTLSNIELIHDLTDKSISQHAFHSSK